MHRSAETECEKQNCIVVQVVFRMSTENIALFGSFVCMFVCLVRQTKSAMLLGGSHSAFDISSPKVLCRVSSSSCDCIAVPEFERCVRDTGLHASGQRVAQLRVDRRQRRRLAVRSRTLAFIYACMSEFCWSRRCFRFDVSAKVCRVALVPCPTTKQSNTLMTKVRLDRCGWRATKRVALSSRSSRSRATRAARRPPPYVVVVGCSFVIICFPARFDE